MIFLIWQEAFTVAYLIAGASLMFYMACQLINRI